MRFLFLLALLLPGSAYAADTTVTATNPASIVSALNSSGYAAQLSKDGNGDPLISFKKDSATFTIFFYGCANHSACQATSFYALWANTKTVTAETINLKWSRPYNTGLIFYTEADGNLAAKAYLKTEPGGVPAAVFIANLNNWVQTALSGYQILTEAEK